MEEIKHTGRVKICSSSVALMKNTTAFFAEEILILEAAKKGCPINTRTVVPCFRSDYDYRFSRDDDTDEIIIDWKPKT